MKFLLSFLSIAFVGFSCKTIDQTKIAKSYPNYLYSSDTTDEFLLKFDTIGPLEYAACKKTYRTKPDRDFKRHLIRTDTNFYVLTKDSAFLFPCDTNDYSKFAYYEGYYRALGMHAVTHIDGHNETGALFLIDKNSNMWYEIPSSFDDPCLPPVLSMDNTLLAAYANNSYADNECCISLIHINKKSGGQKFQLLRSFTTDQWKIKRRKKIMTNYLKELPITNEKSFESLPIGNW
ncbi:MAG: hypothetical protein M3R17_01630 [Bacteroidota bacterium]|nr:hypothetical protein [Bacteroidota bacterium]